MKEFFLDTNIFLRFLVDSKGKQHKECVKLFELIEQRKIKGVICCLILVEVYFTLKSFYKFSSSKCKRILEHILGLKNLRTVDDFNYHQALELFNKTGVKFVDCLIASLGFFQDGGVIISYDKDFDKLGIKRIEPAELWK